MLHADGKQALYHSLKSVKIVVALRQDLLDRVIQKTKDAGFQEEKYQPLYLTLRWTQEQLFGMLDRRVQRLVRRQYTQEQVNWNDVTPVTVHKESTGDYLIGRTLYRPRDLIVFFNACMELAVDRPEITAKMILQAEGEYSQRRLRSICDEWRAEYPELAACVEVLKGRPGRFPLCTLSESLTPDKCLALATGDGARGAISRWAIDLVEGKSQPSEFRSQVASVFYKVGLVGLKLGPNQSESWSFRHAQTLSIAEIRDDYNVLVCPMFYRVLGIVHEERSP